MKGGGTLSPRQRHTLPLRLLDLVGGTQSRGGAQAGAPALPPDCCRISHGQPREAGVSASGAVHPAPGAGGAVDATIPLARRQRCRLVDRILDRTVDVDVSPSGRRSAASLGSFLLHV